MQKSIEVWYIHFNQNGLKSTNPCIQLFRCLYNNISNILYRNTFKTHPSIICTFIMWLTILIILKKVMQCDKYVTIWTLMHVNASAYRFTNVLMAQLVEVLTML